MNLRLVVLIALGLSGCRHDPWALKSPVSGPAEAVDYSESTCTGFLAELDAMSTKELKAENEKIAKTLADKKSDDYPRASLIAGVYQAKLKNYVRAVELLSPLSNRKTLDESCRLSVRLYSGLLSDLDKLENDLAVETKEKLELERKLKALSDIEKEISKRGNKTKGM